MTLGKGALKNGVRIADDVLSGHNLKRQPKDVGKNLLSGILSPVVRPRKRIKRATAKKEVTTVPRQRKRQTSKKREADIFDDGFRA